MSRTAQILAVLCTASLLVVMHAQSPVPAAAQQPYKQGIAAEQQQQLDVALDRFEAALKQAPNDPLCYEAILRVQTEMTNDKAALATAAKMISTAPNAPARAHAEMLQAEIYYRQSSAYTRGAGAYEKDPRRAAEALRKSAAILQRATADDPTNEPLHMLYAHVLAGLHRDDDAHREFVACAAIAGTSPAECARALKLSTNLDLARFQPAPAFKATTLSGTPVSLDSLAGKVVLIDFWGSWCQYCVRDSDYIQSMLDTFSPDSFVLLEVNVGDSQPAWASYVKSHNLKGVQTQDAQSQLQTLFQVSGFPTYFILDKDGIIRMRSSGAVGDIRGDIRKVIAGRPLDPATEAGN